MDHRAEHRARRRHDPHRRCLRASRAIGADSTPRGSGHTPSGRALDGISTRFPDARWTAVMGPSGSGKSTPLHCAAGLEGVTSVEVLLAGADITSASDQELTALRRNAIGFVFQSFKLIGSLTAVQNVALPLRLGVQRVSARDAKGVLASVGLADRRQHRPRELSGGLRQRVAIARAMGTRPAVLLADEPTGALDSSSARTVLELLREMVEKSGQSIVMVTAAGLGESRNPVAWRCLFEHAVGMPQPILTTDRLLLVPLAERHLDLEVGLDSDAEVLRYIFGRARTRAEVVASHSDRMALGRKVDGLGFWMAYRAPGGEPGAADDEADGEFVGLMMLPPAHGPDQPDDPSVAELGYRIARRHWRQGFATEASRLLLGHAFETVGQARVIAQTMTVNEGSRAVMCRLGMRFVRTYHPDWDDPLPGSDEGEVEYELTRTTWLRRQPA